MSTIGDLEKDFEFWINYSKDSELTDVLQKALELMDDVCEKLAEEEGGVFFSPESNEVPRDKVLGKKTQVAFDAFSKFIDKYRPN